MKPLQRVIDNTRLMLQRRGYSDIEFRDDDDNGEKPRLAARSATDPVNVFFIEKNKVSIQVFKAIVALAQFKHIIIVHALPLTPDSKQSIASSMGIFQFEVFTFDEMSYDPIEIVPPHWIVTPRPREWNKLPIILSTDMIARYYLFKHGDIVAVDEKPFLTFRRCV